MAPSKQEKDFQEYVKRVLPELSSVVSKLKIELKKNKARPTILLIERLQALCNDVVLGNVAGQQKGILTIIMLNLAKFVVKQGSKTVMTNIPKSDCAHILELIKTQLPNL